MEDSRDFTPEQEERWREWIGKSREREKSTARKIRAFGLVLISVLVIGLAFWFGVISR